MPWLTQQVLLSVRAAHARRAVRRLRHPTKAHTRTVNGLPGPRPRQIDTLQRAQLADEHTRLGDREGIEADPDLGDRLRFRLRPRRRFGGGLAGAATAGEASIRRSGTSASPR